MAHRNRQEAYRQRLAEAETSVKKVTDQGLDNRRPFGTVGVTEGIMSQMSKEPTSKGQVKERKSRPGMARCVVCGRWGFPFHEGGE
jgi:hypothetical protein